MAEAKTITARSGRAIRVADEYLEGVLAGEKRLLFDGGMGTMLQRRGLAVPGKLPDLLCLSNPDDVAAIHADYVDAGSQVITTNTFGANRLKLDDGVSVEEVYSAGVACARAAGARYVAGDIGPTGELLDPFGDLEFEEACEIFAEQARAAETAGADLIIIETMADLNEMRAAATAALGNTSLPVFATCTFTEHGRTLMGDTPADVARELDELGVDALGINCSLGPADLAPLAAEMIAATDKPVIVQANAGLPTLANGETTYSISPQEYAIAVRGIVEGGAMVVGGCCGTNPDYIRELAAMLQDCASE